VDAEAFAHPAMQTYNTESRLMCAAAHRDRYFAICVIVATDARNDASNDVLTMPAAMLAKGDCRGRGRHGGQPQRVEHVHLVDRRHEAMSVPIIWPDHRTGSLRVTLAAWNQQARSVWTSGGVQAISASHVRFVAGVL
jgi:hypothetical protein